MLKTVLKMLTNAALCLCFPNKSRVKNRKNVFNMDVESKTQQILRFFSIMLGKALATF